jgi:hypothetical protein
MGVLDPALPTLRVPVPTVVDQSAPSAPDGDFVFYHTKLVVFRTTDRHPRCFPASKDSIYTRTCHLLLTDRQGDVVPVPAAKQQEDARNLLLVFPKVLAGEGRLGLGALRGAGEANDPGDLTQLGD